MPYIKKNTPSGPDAFEASYYISKFKEIYGDRYKYFPEDFDKREIGTRNRDLNIRIECTHGIKNINVRRHLEGYECRYCKGTMIDKTVKQPRVAKERKKPTVGWNIKGNKSCFVDKATAVHGDRYSYDKFIYVNCKTKGIITCNIHGDFEQNADSHINARSGCPHCGSGGTYSEWYFRDNPEMKDVGGVLYLVEMSNDTEVFLKIGITEKNANKRFASASKNGGYKCRIILQRDMNMYEAWELEQKILSDFKDDKYNPSVYFPGHTECLSKSKEALIMRGIV